MYDKIPFVFLKNRYVWCVCNICIYVCTCMCSYTDIYAYNCKENMWKDTQREFTITSKEKHGGDTGLVHFILCLLFYLFS